MFRIIFTALFLVTALSFSASAQDKFPYDKYKNRTLSEIVEQSSDFPKAVFDAEGKPLPVPGIPDFMFSPDFLHSQVRVRFMNKVRPIQAETKDVLNKWKTTFNIDDKLLGLFVSEYLFTECNREYWIAVQKQVADYFPKELKTGDMVTLYLIRAAGRKSKDGKTFEMLFLVNEFEK